MKNQSHKKGNVCLLESYTSLIAYKIYAFVTLLVSNVGVYKIVSCSLF